MERDIHNRTLSNVWSFYSLYVYSSALAGISLQPPQLAIFTPHPSCISEREHTLEDTQPAKVRESDLEFADRLRSGNEIFGIARDTYVFVSCGNSYMGRVVRGS